MPAAAPPEAAEEEDASQEFKTAQNLWDSVLDTQDAEQKAWYQGATDYWKTQEATVEGMLGGYGRVTNVDLASSWKFIVNSSGKKTFKNPDHTSRAIDCGAGIGRITKGLLMKICDQVDILEQSEEYVRVAKEELGDKTQGLYLVQGLQSWNPAVDTPGRLYDIVWIQWVSLYLTDEHFIALLDRCTDALTQEGLVYVKDNVTGSDTFQLDKDDNSICRSDAMYRDVFQRAGWKIVRDEIQQHFPDELYEVRMYALAPPDR